MRHKKIHKCINALYKLKIINVGEIPTTAGKEKNK